ncbi:DNA gyrase subunit A [Alphaproteobacteria bacterium]|nr:DNA gyrase subunit A [Alphaproteobacteria bacterium]
MNDIPTLPSDISQVTIEEEMKRSYLDYAMSVIVSRALPDVRDGLKPVHRRILYAMKEGGYDSTKPYRKSARIVGDVMGKYHPHGDQSIYDAMVRMAQSFSMRLPLIDGQGNFGSMDGDRAAAMRYTEARLALSAESLLDDIDKETVDFQGNYDETSQEPTVLPARFPNLLVNGAGGIAVGMATNIPPHNLGEVVDTCLAYLDNPGLTIDEILEIMPGPDFPTGGLILGRSGIRAAYHTGRGSVIMRGRTNMENFGKNREAIIVTEVPYQVNKARMVERIAEVVRDKTIEGISDLRDESDRHGVRVVIELKRDANYAVVLAQLFRYTPLQTSFGVNSLALRGQRPELMNIREIIIAFVEFREEVITRRTDFELKKARERAHILAGLLVAISNIDPVIELIRRAPDPATARTHLMERDWPAEDVAEFIKLIDEPGRQVIDDQYRLSETQARAILELRLQRLTGMERDKLAEEARELSKRIEGFLDILKNRDRLVDVSRKELQEIKEKFGDARRTEIEDAEFEHDLENLIQREEMIITVTHGGYIKRVPLSTYSAQNRGGKGRSGMSTRDEDFVQEVFVSSTHAVVLFFSSRGMVYQLKAYRLPMGSPQARGKAMVNLLPLEEGETISTVMVLPEEEDTWSDFHVVFTTASGNIRRNTLNDFTNIMSNGKIAMKLDDGDKLVRVRTCTEDDDILLVTHKGMCIRFPVPEVRVFSGRTSTGVRGIRLDKGDNVIAMSILRHAEIDMEIRDAYLRASAASRRAEGVSNSAEETTEPVEINNGNPDFATLAENEQFILTVTEKGFGKRTSAYEYRIAKRGGKGIANLEITERNGDVTATFPVEPDDQVMLVTDNGQLIRCPIHNVRIASRRTQGVTLFNVGADAKVVSATRLRDVTQSEETETEPHGEDGASGNEGEDA